MGNKVSSHGAGTVRIMSQNVMCWGDKEARRPLMRRVLTGHGAHFLCLQEVTPTWRGYFEEDLAGYDSVFMYRGAESLEAVPIYWRRDFAELLDSGHFWLSETPEVESYGWGAGCLRIATYGHFRIRETGRELAVINTHLDWESRSARLGGIRLIRRFTEEHFDSELPLVLTGDFNAPRGEATVTVAESFLCDTRLTAGRSTYALTCSDSDYGDEPNVTIDYIFARSGMHCNSFEVISEVGDAGPQSDHLAVMSELIL